MGNKMSAQIGRNNVLFIVFDQMRADALTGALAQTVALPNLSGLMGHAVVFEQHFSVTSPCGPARASLLTGQYAMNHRSVRNGTPLPQDKPNLALSLGQAGIQPLLYGYTDTSPDPRHFPPDDPVLTSYEQVMTGFVEVQEMRFDCNRAWEAYLNAQGYSLGSGSAVFRPIGDKLSSPAGYKAEHSDTAFLTDRVLEDLQTRDAGWFAHVTYIRPHPPFVAPAPYNSLLDPADMPAPLMREDQTDFHPFDDLARQYRRVRDMVVGFDDLQESPEITAMIRAIYMGLVAELDHHIGRIMTWLKDSGQYDETLILVTADHGEMLGDYGCWGKMHYHDAAFHVPLMIKVPHHVQSCHGTRITLPTESIDVSPTILDLLGIEIPDSMDGRPLSPFLTGETPSRWKDVTMSEMDFGDPVKPTLWQENLGLSSRECHLAVLRAGDRRLIHFGGGLDQLLIETTGPHEAMISMDQSKAKDERHRLTQALLSHRMYHAEGRFGKTMITSRGVARGSF